MLQVNNLSVHFADRTLFDKVSFQVNEQERIGLAGRNGAGKSTLLKILSGELKIFEGKVSKPKEYTVGYLKQELEAGPENSVMEEAAKAYDGISQLKEKIDGLTEKIAIHTDFQSEEYANMIDDLSDLSHKYEILEVDKSGKQLEQVLLGLGFIREDFDQPVNTFSGGWQMRVELAKILLKKPDLLLLDEPTNHLDIVSIIWLEKFLKDYPGSIILVSHDKALLDNLTKRTVEIELGKVYDYKANYTQYQEMRKIRRDKMASEKKNQDRFINQTQLLINKFRAKKNKAAFAQTLIRKLEKLERVEIDNEDVSGMKLRFPEPPRSGNIAIKTEGLSKNYDAHLVLDNIDLLIERGEKIAFVGKNGEGKTTLSKILAGTESYHGKFEPGHNVSIGYFAQHQAEMLDGNVTVLDTIDQKATGEMRSKVRSLLGTFLFSGDDVYKKVKVLSGGEKSRLSLAALLLEPVNLLIMDEPTNHLDMISKAILKEALLNYKGSLIIVSHDRDFLDGLTEKIYEFGGKKIREYLGGIKYFLSKKNLETIDELSISNPKKAVKEVKKTSKNKEEYTAKKEQEKKYRKLKGSISKIEKKIAELEEKAIKMESMINDPDFYSNAKDPGKSFQEYDLLKLELKKEMESWERLQEDFEKIK